MLIFFAFALLPCLSLAALWSPVGKADLLALLYVMFSCVFVTFSYDVLGQVCYFIVPIPDLCLLLYLFYKISVHFTYSISVFYILSCTTHGHEAYKLVIFTLASSNCPSTTLRHLTPQDSSLFTLVCLNVYAICTIFPA